MVDEKKHAEILPPGEPKETAPEGEKKHVTYAPVFTPKPTADGRNKDAAPTKKDFEESYKPERWDNSASGRLAIRTFSRGIMGAMFFTAGGLWARKLMMQPELVEANPLLARNVNGPQYHADKDWGKIIEEKNPLQFIAKTIDTFAGRPIESTVNYFGGNGKSAVHFKPTKYSKHYDMGGVKPQRVYGRSLGEESVFVTFDFFCASIGDAMGRDIASWFDPSVKKSWTDGEGNVNLPEAVKSMCKSAFRYVTYNGGEDWAVALPYVYFMKAQRGLFDKLSPGYAYESDLSLNASSLKMNTKTTPHTVAGSYAMEAIMDYQTRFTVYNMGTLLYRELYDKLENAWNGKHVNLYGAPDAPADPSKGFLDDVKSAAKWVARGVIKGAIYMTPAVPFFSITRATQGRERAVFIDPSERSALGFKGTDNKLHFLTVSEARSGEHGITNSTPVRYARYDPNGAGGYGALDQTGKAYDPRVANPIARDHSQGKKFDEYHRRHNIVENAFSFIGEKNQKFAWGFDDWGNSNIGGKGEDTFLKRMLGLQKKEGGARFTRSMANAAVSYLPYMYAKAEFANLWDHGKTDLAVERLIDGVTSFNWKEVKAGADETFNAILHKPFDDPDREIEANRRIAIDTSEAMDQTTDRAEQAKRQQLLAQQRRKELGARVLEKSGGAVLPEPLQDTKPTADAPWYAKIKAAKKDAPASHVAQVEEGRAKAPIRNRLFAGEKNDEQVRNPQMSHAEREDLRKILEESPPLTNSIH